MTLSHFILGMGTFEIARRQCQDVSLKEIISFNEFKERENIIKENYPDLVNIKYLDDKLNNLYPNGDWMLIDKELYKIKPVDIMCSLTPCGQLSSLTKTKNTLIKGPEAEKNKWIYEAIKAYLASGSKYFVLENSGHLSRKKGSIIINNIKSIFKENNIQNIKIHMIRVNALSYGLPQHRERTILILYKKDYFFDIPFFNKKVKLIDFLNNLNVDNTNDPDNVIIKPYNIQKNWLCFLNNNKALLEKYKKLYSNNNFSGIRINKFIKEFPYINDDAILEKVLNQIKTNTVAYDKSPLFPTDSIGAVIRKTLGRTINPITNNYFSIRELMCFMGYPTSFILPNPQKNHQLFYKAIPVNIAKFFIQFLCNENKKIIDFYETSDVLIQVNNHKTGKREFYNSNFKPLHVKEHFKLSFQE